MSNLPTDGRPLFARLWSRFSDGWTSHFIDSTFMAAGAPPVLTKAALISPAPGAMLPGASATFQWDGGHGASQYWLQIGTVQGTWNVYNQDQGAATSAAVSGLPTGGGNVYVRLWSRLAGVWGKNYTDYSFPAAGQ